MCFGAKLYIAVKTRCTVSVNCLLRDCGAPQCPKMEEESSLSGFQGENYRHFKQLIDPRVGKYNLEM